ncbi:cyclin-like protein [Sordaria brevicollis]|uniref:Cyclin-like protein n=1 Tax=Sordaria brevicollis TaxID=83679 RepID=A0AAE0UC36_SORBR|nr:cyclin-like protein [Sordaria brevicollis]
MSHMINPLATPEQLYQRRSFGALPTELQDAIFFSTQCLTQAAGLLLQLPQSVTAQANVLLARYWLVEPMMSYEFSDISAASVYLTAKLSPYPRSPRDVALVYNYLLSPSSTFFSPVPSEESPPPPPSNIPSDYYLPEHLYNSFHTRLLKCEARILYSLSFDTHVSLPHPLAITYLQALDFLNTSKSTISKRTLAYLNTALLSPQMLYLTSQPNALAVAAIYNAAKDVGAKMPECEWWEVFDVDREELGFLVVGMRSVEGWGRKMREDVERMRAETDRDKRGGMITRRDVEGELRRRGLSVGNGGHTGERSSEEEPVDMEAEMARRMDEKMAEIEGSA